MSEEQLYGQDAWAQLLKPWASNEWFTLDPRPPLEPERTEFSAANAWWLAELSRLAYRNARRAPVLASAGLRELAFVSEGGTQCLIALPDREEPEAVLCVFRGSDELRDWWSNLQAVPAGWPAGGRVHRGFRDALDEAWPKIESVLDRAELPELIGGHSLGGALALLSASRRRPAGCYAFGAPRVGDAAFAETLSGVPAFRLAHGRDLVPSLPPSTPVLEFATSSGDPMPLDAVAPDGAWNGPPRHLADHAPARYVEAVRRLIED